MGFTPETLTNSVPGDADYPQGYFKDATTGVALDGTPLKKDWVNDLYALPQRLLLEAGITPSGAADTVPISQYYDALQSLTVATYGTVALMIAADLPVGTLVQTKGYLADGDNGNAKYGIVAPATGTDDGGKFIDLTNTNQAQLITDGPVRSSQYGAIGNGATDDTTNIQNMFDAFDDVVIDTTSKVTTLDVDSNMKIEFINAIIGSSGTVLSAVGVDSTDIILSGSGAITGDFSTTAIGLLLNGCNRVNVYNLVIGNIPIGSGFGISIINGSQNCNIDGGLIQDCNRGIDAQDGTTKYNTISNISLTGNTYGLYLEGPDDNTFNSLNCIGNVKAGIFMKDKTGNAFQNKFNDCECSNGTGSAIDDGGVVISPVSTSNVPADNIFNNLVCVGNASDGVNIFPVTSGSGELSAIRCKFNSLISKGNAKSGINIVQANDIEITNAVCANNTLHGLITDDCDGVTVKGGIYDNNGINGIRHDGTTDLLTRTLTDGATLSNNSGGGVVGDGNKDSKVVNCHFDSNGNSIIFSSTARALECTGDLVTENTGDSSITSSITVNHGLSGTPDKVSFYLTGGNAPGRIITLTSKTPTQLSFTVEDNDGSSPGTSATVEWQASLF